MKKYNQILKVTFLGLMSLGFTSCSDFLDKTPESAYTAETFYQTQSDFVYAIAGAYAAQQDLYLGDGGNIFRFTIGRSDDTNVIETNTYMYGADQFTDGDDNSSILTIWSNLWVLVSRCNAILDRIDAVSFTDTNLKNYIKGEALALRAWSYYSLGSCFGGVPLIDKQMSVDETKKIARSSQEETFAFAAKDYTSAISLLPTSWSGDNIGRITKYAAEAGLARLYMFQSKFSNAQPLLLDIINSGKYAMEEKYENCFDDAYDNGKERVWEVQFNGNVSGEGQGFSGSCVPEGYSGTLSPFSGASAAMHVSSNLLAAYEKGDLRKDASVVTNLKVSNVVLSYYFIRKWLHYTYVPQNTNDFAINLPIVRYTDVLMMYAECLNEAGYQANGEAFNIINKVRSRAGLPALTSATVSSQAAFRTALQKERRIEFAFEPNRWPDLVRWGIAQTTMDKFLQDTDEGAGTYKMGSDNRKIYAIPADEITRYADTSVMWQNPGY